MYNIKSEKIAEGNLDANGYAKVENIGVGAHYVLFPEVDGEILGDF